MPEKYYVNPKSIIKAYFKARKHKKHAKDVKDFDLYFEKNIADLVHNICNGTYNAKKGNYCFVVYRPKPREIFGTCFTNRVVHHYLDTKLRPIYERVYSPRTFNNRKGLGNQACINRVRQDIKELSNDNTANCYITHIDIKGYFPNAVINVALKQQLNLINEEYEGKDKETLKYLMTEVLTADPARNCRRLAPEKNWNKIAPEKSLFNKPVGIGAAIGFLCCQNAMQLYINHIIKWVESKGYRISVFVDDIYIVSKTKKVLKLIPKIRKKLAELGMQLNQKFYHQHYSKGVMCLGRMIKFDRVYLSNKSIHNSLSKVNPTLESVNSYAGLYKGLNSYKFFKMFEEKAKALGFVPKSDFCFQKEAV